MLISGRTVQVECDSCGASMEEETFAALKGEMDENGWRARKIGRDWVHACGSCQMEEIVKPDVGKILGDER